MTSALTSQPVLQFNARLRAFSKPLIVPHYKFSTNGHTAINGLHRKIDTKNYRIVPLSLPSFAPGKKELVYTPIIIYLNYFICLSHQALPVLVAFVSSHFVFTVKVKCSAANGLVVNAYY